MNALHIWLSVSIKSTAAVEDPRISLDELIFSRLAFVTQQLKGQEDSRVSRV